MRNSAVPFEEECFYHIYNRGNNKENLFKEDEHYRYFLQKWTHYLNNYADVWAYCLMPNHFHFLIQIKSKHQLSEHLHEYESGTISELISNQFRKLFISYTKSINSALDRTGSLFQKPFKRVKVESLQYIQHLIHYIHHNPIHHNFTTDYQDWQYSSFRAIADVGPTYIKRQEVLSLFDGKKQFKVYHQEMKNYNNIDHMIIDKTK